MKGFPALQGQTAPEPSVAVGLLQGLRPRCQVPGFVESGGNLCVPEAVEHSNVHAHLPCMSGAGFAPFNVSKIWQICPVKFRDSRLLSVIVFSLVQVD